MTNKSLTYLVLCALLMLISCSEAIVTLPEEEQKAAEAVAFSAYLNRTTSSVSTRAGQNGAIGNEALKVSTDGFGVFAFLGNDDWLYASNTQQPDFMFNQQVTWGGEAWTYSPLKYWPNETGGDATSVSTDRLSFFAYAPYVAVTPETGLLTSHYTGDERTTGITAMSHYHHQGDPWVQYVVSYDADKQVDLCWANVDGNTLDQTKHSVNDPVQLNFHHALSALNVQIDAMMDALSPSGSVALDDGNTRIYMRSVTFEGFSTSGALNLYNRVAGTPRWIGNYGQGLIDMDAVTIHDGRRDRHEGSGANANEWPTGLNPVLIQSGPYEANSGTLNEMGSTISASAPSPGVTATAVNLFTPPSTGTDPEKAPIYVIPNGQPLRVTVAYDVETYDPSLKYQRLSDDQTFGSSVPNVISSWVRLGDDNLVLEAGKQYTLKLHLGMTSVKVDVVSVKAWEDGAIVDVTIPDEPVSP